MALSNNVQSAHQDTDEGKHRAVGKKDQTIFLGLNKWKYKCILDGDEAGETRRKMPSSNCAKMSSTEQEGAGIRIGAERRAL